MSLILDEDQSFSLTAYVTSPDLSGQSCERYTRGAYWEGKHHSDESKKKMSEAKRGEKSINYGKHLPEETKRKLSLALKGRVRSEEHRRNISLALRGIALSEQTKRKISLALKGKPLSEKHKQQISLASKGRVNLGRTPWVKGKHLSMEVRQRVSNSHRGKHCSPKNEFKPGHRCSKETLEKISQALKGRRFSEEHKQKIRVSRLKQIIPKEDTSIELRMQDELARRGIVFEKHLPVSGICQPDIVLPYKKIAIFCDGDYWHNLPKMKNRDKQQDKALTEGGWVVYRFWEHEINQNPSGCVSKIIGEIEC